jgi:hypothetical protein
VPPHARDAICLTVAVLPALSGVGLEPAPGPVCDSIFRGWGCGPAPGVDKAGAEGARRQPNLRLSNNPIFPMNTQ